MEDGSHLGTKASLLSPFSPFEILHRLLDTRANFWRDGTSHSQAEARHHRHVKQTPKQIPNRPQAEPAPAATAAVFRVVVSLPSLCAMDGWMDGCDVLDVRGRWDRGLGSCTFGV